MVTWSTGQKKSIVGVTKKKFEAAAISDDKLQSLLKRGKVAATDYRIIYTSDVIPRTTIGWFYDLKPELAEKLRAGILSFKPEKKSTKTDADDSDSTDSGAVESSGVKNLHFIPVNYKKDFDVVRQIDNSFDPRMGAKPPKLHSIAAAAATTAPSTP
jgi:phosphonate transport system substrate-binding protein